MIRSIGVVLLLVVVFNLALASFAPWDLAIGAVLGATCLWIFHEQLPGIPGVPNSEQPSFPSKVIHFFPFAGITIWEIVVGSVQVAMIVIGLRELDHPGIVAVPIGERSKFGVVVTGITCTLAPGSILLDVDWDRRVMLIHVIDASDPDQVRANMRALYDRYQRKVFP
jgi:multicomponent Na+:H+ antiporter subunit E